MRRSLPGTALTVVTLVLVLAAPATAGLPKAGRLVPGRSLGGIRLGETASAVRGALGGSYGVCRGCRRQTWYFTYRPFDRRGLGVEFTDGHVSALYTLWQPPGWSAAHGLRLGARPLAVHERAGRLRTITCPGYDALVADSTGARTVYYVFGGRLWGFGLLTRGADPCR